MMQSVMPWFSTATGESMESFYEFSVGKSTRDCPSLCGRSGSSNIQAGAPHTPEGRDKGGIAGDTPYMFITAAVDAVIATKTLLNKVTPHARLGCRSFWLQRWMGFGGTLRACVE